jgi:hypothetical protein
LTDETSSITILKSLFESLVFRTALKFDV